ncbi:hypothetical protein [Alkalihalobacterium elongatum]|uniref:hypothetical protein n=1 Tax=Alkalihalobacterium elongatum TaxID=2675466 RepID=UPI001C1F3793|nr:hypothetical protein [Alkalihalobacterium elongatum]
MKSGHIDQFAHLSEFNSVKQFNETIKEVRKQYEQHFTKGEHIALLTLIQHSVKKHGVCNARICKLVAAAQAKTGSLSRSTFERMLRKAQKLGILTVHHTIRQKGGYSHNVYVFHRSDGANPQKLTARPTTENPTAASLPAEQNTPKALLLKTKKHKDQNLRQQRPSSQQNLEALDHTFVPSYVPAPFVKLAKPFFPRAKDICTFWDRTMIAYRSLKFEQPIETLLPVIIQAFKETVYKYKQNTIRTSFLQYFYGTVVGKLVAEKRKIVCEEQPWGAWLGNGYT